MVAQLKEVTAEAPPGTPAWFVGMVEKATAGPQMQVVNLNPDLAKFMLDVNANNRSVHQTKVLQYASDMASGRWALNGEPLIVSTDGNLNDGQHRCLATIEANATVPVVMMFGVERETRLTVDQGAARTAGDYLGMEGMPNAALVAAIARMVIAYENNCGAGLTNANRVTSAEVRERAYRDEALAASATFGHTNSHYSRSFASGSLIGFAHYVLSRVNRADAETFLGRVCRGDGLRMRDPAHTTREKLLNAGKIGRDRKIKLLIQGWNFHRRGMKVAPASMSDQLPLPALL